MQNIKERKYITIGNPVITNDTFRNILRPLNNYGFKPTGGLWASEYISPYQRISPWYEYLIEEKDIARYIKKSNNGRNYWESDDHIFEVDVSDMWCEIRYPEDCM